MGGAGTHAKAHWKEEDEEWTVDCPCGVQTDDGHPMIECEVCNVWAHIHCIGHGEDVEHYICASCRKSTANHVRKDKVRNTKRTSTVERHPRRCNGNHAEHGLRGSQTNRRNDVDLGMRRRTRADRLRPPDGPCEQLAEREKLPDAASLRLARAQVHAEAQASNREQKEALECRKGNISSKVCWDATGLNPKLLGERRQTYLAKLEQESVDRAMKMPPPKPASPKYKKGKDSKNGASKPRCPKAMKKAAWQSFCKQEARAKAVAEAAAKAALEMAEKLHRNQNQVEEQKSVGKISDGEGTEKQAGPEGTSKTKSGTPGGQGLVAKDVPLPVVGHAASCMADAELAASAKGHANHQSACRKAEIVDTLDIKGSKVPRENGNTSPTTTLHQHSDALGSTEDERSSEKEEPAALDGLGCRSGEMDSGETKLKRLKVTSPHGSSEDFSQLDSPMNAEMEVRQAGLENLDTSGMNDEELAMYLHHQLNAPSSRRKARRMHTTSSVGGSPSTKRKRTENSTTLEGQTFPQDSPRSHKAKVANGGYSPHLFRTATS